MGWFARKKKNRRLLTAAYEGHLDQVESVVTAGADPDARHNDGQTPLMRAHGVDQTVLAAGQAVIEVGADVNLEGCDGATPLVKAAFEIQLDFFRLLLENGADPNGSNQSGNSSLIGCWSSGDTEWVELLLGEGAHLDPQNGDGLNAPVQGPGRLAGRRVRRA